MANASPSLVVFGDYTGSLVESLKLLNSTGDAVIKRFLNQAYDSIRAATYDLGLGLRRHSESPESLLGLAELSVDAEYPHGTTLALPLACVIQLGTFLQHISSGFSNGSLLSDAGDSILLADGTGVLSAATVAWSQSTNDIIATSSVILAVAVRLGHSIDRRSQLLTNHLAPWSISIRETAQAVQDGLVAFKKREELSDVMAPYISTYSDSVVTVSGPPPALQGILEHSPFVQQCLPGAKGIYRGPIHAPHLPTLDVHAIIRPCFDNGRWQQDNFRPRALLSPHTGRPYEAESLYLLLCDIASDFLHRPVRFERLAENAVAKAGGQPIHIESIGPSELGTYLHHELRSRGVEAVSNERNIAQSTSNTQSGEGDIAIVGYSGRFPGSENAEDFWRILSQGKDMHSTVPDDRFTPRLGAPALGCFYEDVGLFDCRLFNMSPREAAQTDPGQRLLLMVVYEALEKAGYSPNSTPSTDGSRIGTFFGQTTDDWREYNVRENVDMFYVPGTIRAFGPGRINYYFNWDGPSYSFDTACSSSSVAVQMACSSLMACETDMAVAGGSNVLTGPSMFEGLNKGGFLSKTGSCKTFDAKADGYCRADGVGAVVLKRLNRAVAEGDNIYGVIKAAATNHSAHAISITHPDTRTQSRLFRQVLDNSGLEPCEIDYIEMHGTGTPVGDKAELNSVLSVFGQRRSSQHRLYIGAAKANIGHGEAAAGITSIIKALLMFQHGKIPPHVGIKDQGIEFLRDLEASNISVAPSVVDLGRHREDPAHPTRIMVNNFSAAGGNTCLLLEEAPQKERLQSEDGRTCHVVVVSGRTQKSLKLNVQRLLEYLQQCSLQKNYPSPSLRDISYTTTARRIHHALRKSYTATTTEQLISTLNQDLQNWVEPPSRGSSPTVAFIFTGQGGQYAGMGSLLFKTCSSFRQTLHECESLAISHGLPSFLQVISDENADIRTFSSVQTQLGVVSLDYALGRLLLQWGLQPGVVCGHSLGEYAAFCISGVISLSSMIFLVGRRAELMASLCSSGTHVMTAARMPRHALQDKLEELQLSSVEIAALNSPSDTVAAGPVQSINSLEHSLKARGIQCFRINTPYAFHSSHMDEILEPFSNIAKRIPMADPTIPIASTLLGTILTSANQVSGYYFPRQCRAPVNMVAATDAVKTSGLANDSLTWVECGPHPLCLPMIAANSTLGASTEQLKPCLKRGVDAWQNLVSILARVYTAGLDLSWNDYHKDDRKSMQLLELPTYSFDLKKHWLSPRTSSEAKGGVSNISIQAPKEVKRSNSSTLTHKPHLNVGVLQRVESREFDGFGVISSVQFASQLDQGSILRGLAEGHVVEGFALVPSSVYAEMAIAAASYVHELGTGTAVLPSETTIRMTNLVISRPLVVESQDSSRRQHQRLRILASWEAQNKSVQILISSRNSAQERLETHATCTMQILHTSRHMSGEDDNCYSRSAHVAFEKHAALVSASRDGAASRLQRPLIYHLFQRIVTYDTRYQGMNDIIFSPGTTVAASVLRFSTNNANENSVARSFRLDNIAQLGGFLLNVACAELNDHAFISSGWGSLVIVADLEENVNYPALVEMTEVQPGLFRGDVHVLRDDETLVAACEGLEFRRVPRDHLRRLLAGSTAPVTARNTTQSLSRNQIEVASKRMPETDMSGMPDSQHSEPAALSQDLTHESNPALYSIQFDQILSIVAEETNHDQVTWNDDTRFSELGVDSLLATAILGRVHDTLDMDLPSLLFHEFPTVRELRNRLGSNGTVTSRTSANISRGNTSRGTSPSKTSVTTKTTLTSQLDSPDSKSIDTAQRLGSGDRLGSALKSILCSEMGLEEHEFDDTTSLREIGLDSVVSNSIVAQVHQRLNHQLSSTFFIQHDTLSDIRRALNSPRPEPISNIPTPNGTMDWSRASISDQRTDISNNLPKSSNGDLVTQKLRSNGNLLSGDPLTAAKTLFLVPEGTGSGLAYFFLGQEINRRYGKDGDQIPVLYGLDSPFLSRPKEFSNRVVSVEHLASVYIREIRRLQPWGPYNLGGWSIGGIHAFEIARQLRKAGQAVELLLLLDSPCPGWLPPFPADIIFEGIGISMADAPDSLVQHVRGNLLSLNQYRPLDHHQYRNKPLAHTCVVVWAGQSPNMNENGEKPTQSTVHSPAMDWFFGQRKDSGPCGWDILTGGEVVVEVVPSATHFNIMKEGSVSNIATILKACL